jgi:N-methylhydantoinase A
MADERYALGVDVGGTFTDLALVRLSDKRIFYHKIPSTPEDPSLAVTQGVEELIAGEDIDAGAITYFGHGTTVATNACIQGRTALTGLLTTAGFRDVLEIRRQRQPHNYDIRMPKPVPPVPRHLRYEVDERTYIESRPAKPPRVEELEAIVDGLRRAGTEAVAVCFLHSYLNPEHEQTVSKWVQNHLPDAFVCTSHEVLAEFREYERLSTTVLNASLGPIMSRYLQRLTEGAERLGLAAKPYILQSNGGVVSATEAARQPVRTLASGPAAGVIGAIHLSLQAGAEDIITFDAGGTSTDMCLIEGGTPPIAQEREMGGYPVRVPMVDVHSVGAGGGSIAWLDPGGVLQVGPMSAGADPGPACYGRGGSEPTVTDANVVLGRLHPEALLGGRMPIRADLAREAIERGVAKPMGMSLEEAACGVLTILNENLIQAIRVISVEQGFDPREFTLVAFGGAGPLLASALAKELGIGTVLVPESPGLLCALGLLVADVRRDFSVTRITALDGAEKEGLSAAFAELEGQAVRWCEEEGIPPEDRILRRAADIRYLGQSHELTVEFAEEWLNGGGSAQLASAFRREHERVYGYAPEAPTQVATFRMSVLAKVADPPAGGDAASAGPDLVSARAGTRRVFFAELDDYAECPVYLREHLPQEAKISGPAIIEQMDTTTVVLPGQSARRDDSGMLVLSFRS